MAAAAMFDFWNREILLVIRVHRLETYQHVKFCQNWSIGCKDIKIFRFFKMAAATILDFQICEILFADGVWMAQTHNSTKFRRNWSLSCGDIAIFRIFKMAATAILDFWNREILLDIRVQRFKTHLRAKFCQNRSISCKDIKIIRFFKMAAAAILDFQICEILLADGVWMAQTHNSTKFRRNWSFRCGDIAIFRIFKMAAAPSWIFEIAKFYWLLGSRRWRRISMKNFVKIGQSVVKTLSFSNFWRWRPSAILDLFGAYLDNPQWLLRGLYHSAKFGYDRCRSFYNMNISIFGSFGWKIPIHAPKIGVLGQFETLYGLQYQQKGTSLRESASFKLLSVKMWSAVWPVGALLKKGV